MRLVEIVHEKAGRASVPPSTARVLARSGWKPAEGEDEAVTKPAPTKAARASANRRAAAAPSSSD